jgi:hypothetical protein
VTIRKAKNGGFIVRHSYDNMGKGESYRPSEEHAFTSHADMMGHVAKHLGAAAPPAERGGANPAGVGSKPTKQAPGPHSKGAGMD